MAQYRITVTEFNKVEREYVSDAPRLNIGRATLLMCVEQRKPGSTLDVNGNPLALYELPAEFVTTAAETDAIINRAESFQAGHCGLLEQIAIDTYKALLRSIAPYGYSLTYKKA